MRWDGLTLAGLEPPPDTDTDTDTGAEWEEGGGGGGGGGGGTVEYLVRFRPLRNWGPPPGVPAPPPGSTSTSTSTATRARVGGGGGVEGLSDGSAVARFVVRPGAEPGRAEAEAQADRCDLAVRRLRSVAGWSEGSGSGSGSGVEDGVMFSFAPPADALLLLHAPCVYPPERNTSRRTLLEFGLTHLPLFRPTQVRRAAAGRRRRPRPLPRRRRRWRRRRRCQRWRRWR